MSAPATASFPGLLDLASQDLGGQPLLCSDDFFAGMENLVKPAPAAFDPDAYTERGKLMDGWESRRKRVPGPDWCIVKLGVRGTIRAVDIDTSFFMGNHPPFASLWACDAAGSAPESLRDHQGWTLVVPEMPLRRGSSNVAVATGGGGATWTHVKLVIYPDGGVARLRVYGEPARDDGGGEIDLVGAQHGGRAVACSDAFFSSMDNLVLPTRAPHMGHGWETRRSRPPGEDWIILRLGRVGVVNRLLADTHHFKGNYPDRCAVDGILWPDAPPHALVQSADWSPVVRSSKLRADSVHTLDVADPGPWSHLRLRILPDGGVSRLRAFGLPAEPACADPAVERVNAANADRLTSVCGSRRWVAAMMAARPFVSPAHLYGTAEDLWWHLGDGDWREAFGHHPQIGADVETLRARFAHTAAQSAREQAGVAGADDATLAALAKGNADYLARFGFIFLVCATGKTADEMLALLRERIDNEPANELRIAAGEQVKITRLRLAALGSKA